MTSNEKTAVAVGAAALLLWWLSRYATVRPIGAIRGSKLLPDWKPPLEVDVSTVNGDPFVSFSGGDAFHGSPPLTALRSFTPSLIAPASSVWPSMIGPEEIKQTTRFLCGDMTRRNDLDVDYNDIERTRRSDELTGEILGWIGKIIGMIGPIGKIFGMAISGGGDMAMEVAGDKAALQAKTRAKLPFNAFDPRDPLLLAVNSVHINGDAQVGWGNLRETTSNWLGDSGVKTFYDYFASRKIWLNDIAQYSPMRMALFARHPAGWLWPWLSTEFCGAKELSTDNQERARRRAPIYRTIDMMLAALYPIFPSYTPGVGAGSIPSGFVDAAGNDTGWVQGAPVGAGRYYYVNPFFGPMLGATLPPGGDDMPWTDAKGITYTFDGKPSGSRAAEIQRRESTYIADPNILNAAMKATLDATGLVNAQENAAATQEDISANRSGAETFATGNSLQSQIHTVQF